MSLILIVYVSSLLSLLVGYAVGYFRIFRRGWTFQLANSHEEKTSRGIDVVVPVRDESDLLESKLHNLHSQTYPHELFDVIVVDSCRDDAVAQVIDRVSQDHKDLRLITIKDNTGQGKYHALNLAFRTCRSDFVIVTDVDVLTDHDGIEKLMRNFDDPKVGAVSAMETDENQFGELRAYRNFYNILRLAESRLDSVVMCESNFSAYRRKLIDELPGDTQCDDLALTAPVLSKNYRAIYDPRVLFYEKQRNLTRFRMLSQKLRRARANVHELLKTVAAEKGNFPPVFRNLILPFEIFVHVLGPALFLVCLASLLLLVGTSNSILLVLVASFVPLALAVVAGGYLSARISKSPSLISILKMGLAITYAFIEYNMILLIACGLVAFKGPQTSWKRP